MAKVVTLTNDSGDVWKSFDYPRLLAACAARGFHPDAAESDCGAVKADGSSCTAKAGEGGLCGRHKNQTPSDLEAGNGTLQEKEN